MICMLKAYLPAIIAESSAVFYDLVMRDQACVIIIFNAIPVSIGVHNSTILYNSITLIKSVMLYSLRRTVTLRLKCSVLVIIIELHTFSIIISSSVTLIQLASLCSRYLGIFSNSPFTVGPGYQKLTASYKTFLVCDPLMTSLKKQGIVAGSQVMCW